MVTLLPRPSVIVIGKATGMGVGVRVGIGEGVDVLAAHPAANMSRRNARLATRLSDLILRT